MNDKTPEMSENKSARQKIFTERAHLMCPNMNFGIVMSVNAAFDADRLRDSFKIISEAHPFLKAILGYEASNNSYFYDVTDHSTIDLRIMDYEVSGIGAPDVIAEYEKLISCDWDLFSEGMLKAAVWRMGEKTCFLLVFHHLLADGRGALDLALELADVYVNGKMPSISPEKLITASDLPVDSKMPLISRMLVNKANRDRAKEEIKFLTYGEYHSFADEYIKKDKVTHRVTRVSDDEVSSIVDSGREAGVTVNDILLAKMFIEENTGRIVIASDLRERLNGFINGSLGNYSTAFSVEVKKHESDVLELAKEIHKKVQKTLSSPKDLWLVLQCYANLSPDVLDGAFMASQGAYQSRASEFIGKMFFAFEHPSGYSLTNLGKTESGSIDEACFIPPASPAIKKTRGVLTVNGRMYVAVSER